MLRQFLVLTIFASLATVGSNASIAGKSLSLTGEVQGSTHSGITPATIIAAPPVGETYRYAIPHFVSSTGGASTSSFAAVSIRNASKVTCTASVTFQYASGAANVCVMTQSIPANESRVFCTRNGDLGFIGCQATCSPELTFQEGHALVSSTTGGACGAIQIDAQEFYVNAVSPAILLGASQLSVTNLKKSNGD